MSDEFRSFADTPQSPARNLTAVTPHDTDALAAVSKALFVGGAGNIALRAVDDAADVTLVGVVAGQILPICASHIRATNTTATNIVALY